MYRKILVTLDGTPGDEAILQHVRGLARLSGASLVLFHVADGWEARFLGSGVESEEAREDTKYLEGLTQSLRNEGFAVEAMLGFGDPGREIVRLAGEHGCDLIAMSTHGRTGVGRWFLGSVAEKVLRASSTPLLLLRAPGAPTAAPGAG